jgi:hypothetical protein
MASQPVEKDSGAAFFILGLALVAVGASREPAIAVVGIAFIVIGAVRLRRSRRD